MERDLMCEQCRKIDAEIAYYNQRLNGAGDRTAIGLFKHVVAALHPRYDGQDESRASSIL
jgi:hypothetical protein